MGVTEGAVSSRDGMEVVGSRKRRGDSGTRWLI
jgi:hypothetical protein